MLGGTDNALFLQAFGGFLVLPIFVLLAWWTVGSKKDLQSTSMFKKFKNSLRSLQRN